jgi:hypothetical protein
MAAITLPGSRKTKDSGRKNSPSGQKKMQRTLLPGKEYASPKAISSKINPKKIKRKQIIDYNVNLKKLLKPNINTNFFLI